MTLQQNKLYFITCLVDSIYNFSLVLNTTHPYIALFKIPQLESTVKFIDSLTGDRQGYFYQTLFNVSFNPNVKAYEDSQT